jgi:hypothetical protein
MELSTTQRGTGVGVGGRGEYALTAEFSQCFHNAGVGPVSIFHPPQEAL